ncbi:cardiac phospholamban isoform X1 [Electrophorus electricus]|uniref:cardiac phospholamban isoform X1 n=1 Tax=Electrophorus electricus TaxID=8005 RepID=UPI0015D04472|nr:cardiac phospholamban isoform X1 [Electrophorus electricus]
MTDQYYIHQVLGRKQQQPKTEARSHPLKARRQPGGWGDWTSLAYLCSSPVSSHSPPLCFFFSTINSLAGSRELPEPLSPEPEVRRGHKTQTQTHGPDPAAAVICLRVQLFLCHVRDRRRTALTPNAPECRTSTAGPRVSASLAMDLASHRGLNLLLNFLLIVVVLLLMLVLVKLM